MTGNQARGRAGGGPVGSAKDHAKGPEVGVAFTRLAAGI
jgi:hypothetical protein